jgi:hypothetical protein
MKVVLRASAAVLAGLLVLLILLIAVELFSAVVHPLPADFDGTSEEMCQHVARYPHWVLVVVVPAWAGAALASVWTAQRIGNLYSAAIVGLFLLAGLVLNISMLPYPAWFKLSSLLAIPAAVLAGIRLSTPRKTADAAGN